MELQERLSQLESVRDWQGLLEELEKGIAGTNANAAKAAFHLRIGRLLETKFLAGVKALKHFQDAYKRATCSKMSETTRRPQRPTRALSR
jgi:hypothetical protein